MRIGIDASDITNNKAGIGYYVNELVKSIINQDKANQYFLYTHDEELLKEFHNRDNVKIIEVRSPRVNFRWIWRVTRNLRKEKIELFISPSYFTFGILFPRTIQIVHDIAPVTFPQFWPKISALKFKLQLRLSSYRTKLFAAISNTTAKELNEYFPATKNKTFYIGVGLHSWTKFQNSSEEANKIKVKYNLPENYILSVSTLQPRKNYINMIRAFDIFSQSNTDFKYLIAGNKGWYFDDIFRTVNEHNLNEKVQFLDYVPEEDLPTIYDNAKALAYCSFEEGAGLPIIEAISRGVPVVVSDIPVFHEIANDYASYCNPNIPSEIANTLSSALVKRKVIVNKEFIQKYSWDNVGANLIQLYNKIF